eukprot:3221016-Alexandrium_andersonii.AAC.1
MVFDAVGSARLGKRTCAEDVLGGVGPLSPGAEGDIPLFLFEVQWTDTATQTETGSNGRVLRAERVGR